MNPLLDNNTSELIRNRIKNKYPDFEKAWKDIVLKFGDDVINIFKDTFKDEYSLFKEISSFHISIVIDNNFILGQIMGALKKDKKLEETFIYRISKIRSVKLYAPHYLKEELFDKINSVIKEDKELATQYATTLLQSIEIKDAFWVEEWKRANNLIGHTDNKDVPYLALAFHVGSHAIASQDGIFKGQHFCKAWSVKDMDKVITNYNKGFLSFCFINSTPTITQIIWEIFVSIFKIIAEIVCSLIGIIGMLLAGTVGLLSNIPIEIWLLIVGAGLIAYFKSESFRNGTHDLMIKLKELLKSCLEQIGKFIEWMMNLIKEIWEVFKPIGITTLEFAGFFMAEYGEMVAEVEKLENEKAK